MLLKRLALPLASSVRAARSSTQGSAPEMNCKLKMFVRRNDSPPQPSGEGSPPTLKTRERSTAVEVKVRSMQVQRWSVVALIGLFASTMRAQRHRSVLHEGRAGKLPQSTGGWLALLLTLLQLGGCSDPLKAPPKGRPQFTLWAWHAEQDLRFVPNDVDIAVLVADIRIEGGTIDVQRRRQPVQLPQQHRAPIAVVRLETHGSGIPAILDDMLTTAIAERMNALHASGVMIDFDARVSERADAVRVLQRLRQRLAPQQTLSMTGLASWCTEDTPWFTDAPVSEVVPQLFRLGKDADIWRARYANDNALRGCGDSVGVSTDEAHGPVPGAKRVYVFHPGAWTPQAFDEVVAAWR